MPDETLAFPSLGALYANARHTASEINQPNEALRALPTRYLRSAEMRLAGVVSNATEAHRDLVALIEQREEADPREALRARLANLPREVNGIRREAERLLPSEIVRQIEAAAVALGEALADTDLYLENPDA